MKNFLIVFFSWLAFISCNESKTTQIGENTFVHNEIVYRIIDNQITELGTLRSDTITKSRVLKPQLRNFGSSGLDFVKQGVYTELTAVYRGDVLYFNIHLNGLNDLREKYRGGSLTLNFTDDYGFEIKSESIGSNELIGVVDSNGKIQHFEFNGKVQMSSEMYRAIFTYTVTAALAKRNIYGY